MLRKQQFLTPVQDIAVNLVFAVMDETRINRTLHEYRHLAANLPPLKKLLGKINDLLKRLHQRSEETGIPLPLLCRFKAGDKRIVYESYPRVISSETLRIGLTVAGFRSPRGRRKPL